MRVILFGPPGSGKGTQARELAEKFKVPHIATGDMFREAASRGTELGKRLAKLLGRGELVPDELVIEVVKERLSQDDTKEGFILDGFPRTIPQARALDEILGGSYVVVKLDVPDDEVIRRISGRRTCINCGGVFNVYSNPPEVEGKCDFCGSELIVREDDVEEKVRRRLEVYKQTTACLNEYYGGKVRVVDGTGSPDEVFKRLLLALK